MIVSPDSRGVLDAPVYNILNHISIDVPLVPMNMFRDYQFNEDLYRLDKWAFFDFGEYGANSWRLDKTHLYGSNSHLFSQVKSNEYKRFDDFVRSNPPVVYFKRELLEKDKHGYIYPIEFPSFNQYVKAQSKDEFNSRPISVFHYWGHSHESRRALHGNIFINSSNGGYGVVDNFYHFEQAITEYKNVWATIQVPHYARIPMAEVLTINGMSKLSVSLPGAGIKCFRHSESSLNSVMVMRDDPLAWAYPWANGENCIKIPCSDDFEEIRGLKNQWKAIETIESALQRNDLYDIYLSGVETCDKYRIDRYCKEYIEPIIKKHL